jgi:hypothetical protein
MHGRHQFTYLSSIRKESQAVAHEHERYCCLSLRREPDYRSKGEPTMPTEMWEVGISCAIQLYFRGSNVFRNLNASILVNRVAR